MDRMTLLDLATASGSDNSIAVINGMVRDNPLLQRMPFRQVSGETIKYERWVTAPTVYWKGNNQGVVPSKGAKVPIYIDIKDLGSRSIADKKKAERYPGGVAAYRAEQDQLHQFAMANELARATIYGNSYVNPNEPDGIATILNTLSKTTVVNAGGSNANAETSIYAYSFGTATTSQGVVPGVEGLVSSTQSSALLPNAIDMGRQYTLDLDGLSYLAYITEFEASMAFAVYDDRAVGRIANIDATHKPTLDMFYDLESQMNIFKPDLYVAGSTAYGYIQKLQGASNFYYVNPVTNIGTYILTINGIPIIKDTNILATEAVVA